MDSGLEHYIERAVVALERIADAQDAQYASIEADIQKRRREERVKNKKTKDLIASFLQGFAMAAEAGLFDREDEPKDEPPKDTPL